MERKEAILQAIKSGEAKVDLDAWFFDYISGNIYAIHSVEYGSGSEDIHVAFPENSYIRSLRDDLEEIKEVSWFPEVERSFVSTSEELRYALMEEHTDIFDYDATPEVLIDGWIQG